MRIKLIVFLLLISVVSSLKANEHRIISDEEVRDTANAQLDIWLEKLEGGLYKDFGFNNIEEMSRVELGTPYEMVFVSEDFITDSVFIKGKNYFIKENRSWIVPLLVDSEMRCYVSVYYLNDSLNISKIGGAEHAKEIEVCMEKYAIPTEGKKYIFVPGYVYYCDFILHFEEDKNNYQLFPLIENTVDWECEGQVSYNRHNSLEGFFYSHKNNEYNSIPDISNDICPFEIYPNPLISKGVLKGFVPITMQVFRLEILDARGSVVSEKLIDERGHIEIGIDGGNKYKKGIYFYRLIMDESSITKRVLIAK